MSREELLADQDEVNALWAKKAESRIDAYEQGKMRATPSKEVFAELLSGQAQ